MKDKHPKVDAKKQYVMKHRDRTSFVHQLTPMLDGPELGNAHRFEGQWLNDTCWRWSIFYIPIEVDEAFKLYAPKRVVRERVVSDYERKRNQLVRRQVKKDFPPMKKKIGKLDKKAISPKKQNDKRTSIAPKKRRKAR